MYNEKMLYALSIILTKNLLKTYQINILDQIKFFWTGKRGEGGPPHPLFPPPPWKQSCSSFNLLVHILLKKVIPQRLHWYGFSPLCTCICILRFSLYENELPHSWHWYGFSLVCVHLCLFWELQSWKVLKQWLQLYGLSPVWILRCLERVLLSKNALSQCRHWYSFSP